MDRHRARVVPKVVMAGSVREALVEEAPGYDLVLLGTSNQWIGRRILFGTIPDALFTGPFGTSVAVVRRALPISTRLTRASRRLFQTVVPQMERSERVVLAETLNASSRFNFDFIFLTCLATLIASLGLIAGNVAVVIGAMLVAPLMTPLIGAGLSLVQGNLVFLRDTLNAVSLGYLLALAIACAVGVIVRPDLTAEMASRGRPGVLDLAVAFFSGMAAAYCMARPNLSAALPGVAIAASLVPPIAATGLALSMGEGMLAVGGALLFFTNIVAFVLGATLSLFAGGVRSYHLHGRQEKWVRRLVLVAFLLAAILVIPLLFLLADRLGGA